MDLHSHAADSPTQPQLGVAAKEITYVCMYTGNVVTIGAGEEPQFVLGQLIMLVAVVLISLNWLASSAYSLLG